MWRRLFTARRWRSLSLRLGRPIPHAERPEFYDWLCARANRVYEPRPYSGPITVFSSEGNSGRQQRDWQRVAHGGLTILEVPTNHDDMILPPFSKTLAKYLDECLAASSRQ